MQSYEVLREAAERVGVKVLAAKLKLSPALVYKWCEAPVTSDPDASGTRNPLDRVVEVVRLTGYLPVLYWLCQQFNGFYVHNPDPDTANIEGDLLVSTQQPVLAFSELLNEVSESVADDGAIEHNEARRIRREWEQLKITAETFVVACEKGVYRARKR